MTAHDLLYLMIAIVGWAGVIAVLVFKGGGITTEIKATHTLLSEMKSDAKEHREKTDAHGVAIARLETKHDLADKLADALADALTRSKGG